MSTQALEETLSPSDGIGVYDVLHELADGAYIVDMDRRIRFWNRAAEVITGWKAEDVVGRTCRDNILMHSDKDGHLLCGKEFCPLHRAMVTEKSSSVPTIMFARSKRGELIPVQVTVSPLRSAAGVVLGGIEVFRSMESLYADLLRAKSIQNEMVRQADFQSPFFNMTVLFEPQEFVGGDFFWSETLSDGRFVFFLADVMGHGLAAALYTMQLRSIWENHRHKIESPQSFMMEMNEALSVLVGDTSYYATALLCLFDQRKEELSFVNAGNPPFLTFDASGSVVTHSKRGFPLGLHAWEEYEVHTLPFRRGDGFLAFTDGAFEAKGDAKTELGVEGFLGLLKKKGYPGNPAAILQADKEILRSTRQLTLQDDLTVVDIRYR